MLVSTAYRFPTILMGAVFTTLSLLSFTIPFGGDTYTVYINDKLLATQLVGHSSERLIPLPLYKLERKDQIRIHYNHCGKLGKNRKIMIRNDKSQLLKTWLFADLKDKDMYMVIMAGELIDLSRKYNKTTLNLYYASDEIPAGKALAAISGNGKPVAGFNKKEKPKNNSGEAELIPAAGYFAN